MQNGQGLPVVRATGLVVDYPGPDRAGRAVDGLDFDLEAGEKLAIIGESGCGKSTTALAIGGLLPRDTRCEGSLLFAGKDLLNLDKAAWRGLRGSQIGMIFQEPMTSLNPVYTVGQQIAEMIEAHESISRRALRARLVELLDFVHMPDPARRVDNYPHELSGGQRQRAMIALAVALRPRLLIADEPTTALDASVKSRIMALLDRLQREMGMSILLISHDLPLVSQWADRILVMHHGQKIEELPAGQLFAPGRHAYTQGLAAASPIMDEDLHYTRRRLPEVVATQSAVGTWRFDLTAEAAPAAAASAARPSQAGRPLLSVQNLVVRYPSTPRRQPPAVRGIDFDIGAGETLGLVGESGSGKSSLSKAVMRLIPAQAGTVLFAGEDILSLRGARLRTLRPRIQMVFQDPFASLNPRHHVEDILGGPLTGAYRAADISVKVAKTLDLVGLPRTAAHRFPHEFSGGQRQRIGIARALIRDPELVICDEPVSALDVSVQAQILNLLIDLKAEKNLSYLFISHDLAVVQYVSDRIMVMQAGSIVETADRQTLFLAPRHPYTIELIQAQPRRHAGID